jgi:hypothetical protein
MTNPSKQKGTAYETRIVDWLLDHGHKAERRTLSGAADRGDIKIEGHSITIEAKNCKAITLAAWADELEAERINSRSDIAVLAIARRGRPAAVDSYFVMSGETFLELLDPLGAWGQ